MRRYVILGSRRRCKKTTNISRNEGDIFHLKYMKQELTLFHYFHVLSGDLELLKGHELEEDVNTFLFMYKFPDVEKWRAKIVKDAQLPWLRCVMSRGGAAGSQIVTMRKEKESKKCCGLGAGTKSKSARRQQLRNPLYERKPNNENKNTRSKASTTTHSSPLKIKIYSYLW